MKKIISMILSLSMILAIAATMGISVAAAPEGTAINSAAEFAAMAADGKYYLNADITLDATYANEFTGTLDGNGKAITVSAPAFNKLAGTVKNLTIKGTVDTSAAASHAGALAATVSGKTLIDGVKNEASVKGYVTAGDGPEVDTVSKGRKPGTGGIVGVTLAEITISNSTNSGAVNGYAAGGILGLTDGEFKVTITNCKNTGAVSNEGVTANVGDGNGSIAGIVGCLNKTVTTTIDGCVNSGKITATYKQATGGIVGGAWRDPATSCKEQTCVVIKNCVNNGQIEGGWQTGGIAGWMRINVSIENCRNTAVVSSNQSYAGGIIGRAGDTAKGGYVDQTDASAGSITLENTDKYTKLFIKKCVNEGNVTSYTGQAGGMVGYGETPIIISDSINKGSVSRREGATANLKCGGFIGACVGAISLTNCINYGKVEGQGSCGGLVGNVANPIVDKKYYSVYGTTEIHDCANFADVTSSDGYAAGLAGYVYGTGICFADIQNSVNTGKISAGTYGSQFVAYTNNNSTIVKNCIGTGSVTAKEERSVFVGLSSADVLKYQISGNFIAEGHGMVNYSYADDDKNDPDKNWFNRHPLTEAPEGAFTVVAADKLTDAAASVNSAIGSNVFEIKDGKVSVICNHKFLSVDGKCASCGEVGGANTGDATWIYVALASVAILGTAVVIKKREN